MKRKTANTVISYFNVLDAGVIIIPFDNFIDSFKIFSWGEGMIMSVVQTKVINNGPKMITESVRNFFNF